MKSISLSVCILILCAVSAFAQAPEELARDAAIVTEIENANGSSLAVDQGTRLGKFLREYNLAPAGASQISVTDDIIERARAVKEYFSRPRYFVGKEILTKDTASDWITHRASIKEVLPNNQYNVEVVEVEEYNTDWTPKNTRTVERILSYEDIANLNEPTQLKAGKSYFGILYDPENDPKLREAMEKADRIVDEFYPDFRDSPEEISRQQRRLFLEMMKIGKALDYPPRGSNDAYTAARERLARDPHYGSRTNMVGAYLTCGYGVCTQQISTATQQINRALRRAGIDIQLVSGITLNERAGHGFGIVNFRHEHKRRVTDPTWENNREWWRSRDPERYDGQLLLETEFAFGKGGFNRNRRVTGSERTPDTFTMNLPQLADTLDAASISASKGISKTRLRKYIENLESFGTRFVGADNHEQVAEHVKATFRKMGYQPESHRFEFPIRLTWNNGDWRAIHGKALENIVARIPGRDRALAPILLTAHYDSINWNSRINSINNPNAAAPGADDAGSGMSVLFEVARALRGQTFDREVRFVAFDAEETGLAGSQEYVKDLKARGENVQAVLNFDMVGYGNKLELEVPQEAEWLLREFQRVKKSAGLKFDVRYHVGPSRASYNSQGALRGSDHSNFIRDGFDAITGFEATLDPEIWNRNYNPNYHYDTDRVSTLNFDLIANTARLTAATISELAVSSDTRSSSSGRLAPASARSRTNVGLQNGLRAIKTRSRLQNRSRGH